MAKTPAKSPQKTAVKKASAAPKAKSASPSIEKVTEEALKKLKELDLDHQLQADIEWCLGSYRTDGNPVGLYEMAEKALSTLNVEKAKKTKGVTAKLTGDLEKALASR